jgi:hypothetical protein
MKEHLTKKAADWFQDPEAWKSFVDLIPLKADIERVWLDTATEKLREHFTHNLCPGWQFQRWGVSHDTWWFLEEFGQESVGIGFGWRYYFCLGVAHGMRVDRTALEKALGQPAYLPLVKAFGRIDQPIWNNTLEQYGDFSFGSDSDRRLPAHELAWYAGNKTDSFVAQAAAKIEAFARNPEITALLRQLNQELLTPPAPLTIRA